jgi:hypothetical protein
MNGAGAAARRRRVSRRSRPALRLDAGESNILLQISSQVKFPERISHVLVEIQLGSKR